jgi:hypothetical protein
MITTIIFSLLAGLFLMGRIITSHYNYLIPKRILTVLIMLSIIIMSLLSGTSTSLMIVFLIFCLSGDIFNAMKEDANDVIVLSGVMFMVAHILLVIYLIRFLFY